MIISVRRVSRFVRTLLFVLLFSFILFKLLGIVQGLIQPTNKYKEPVGGDAVKVTAIADETPDNAWEEMLARLTVFYKIGE